MAHISQAPLSATPTQTRRRPSLDFSLTGLIYVAMMLFLGFAAVNNQHNLLFAVFGLLIGILLVSGTISRLVLRKLDSARVMPEHGVVGRRLTLEYIFTNRKRFWPSFSVMLSELQGAEGLTTQPHAFMLHAAAGMDATVAIEVIPKRRGLTQFSHYQLSTSFPFGFIRRAVTREHRDALLVFPAIAEVDPRLLAKAIPTDHSGAMARPRRGGSDEFFGVAEFRSGDNPRKINWRRTARTGTLVVNEMQQVAPPRLVLFVDTHLGEGTLEDYAGVEASVAMAASLADHALDRGMAVGLHVWANGWISVPPSRGKRHRRDLLTELAKLPANTDHDAAELLDNSEQQVRAGVTGCLVSRRPAARGGGGRGNWLSVSPEHDSGMFRFSQALNFAACIPLEQLEQSLGAGPPKGRFLRWRRTPRPAPARA